MQKGQVFAKIYVLLREICKKGKFFLRTMANRQVFLRKFRIGQDFLKKSKMSKKREVYFQNWKCVSFSYEKLENIKFFLRKITKM